MLAGFFCRQDVSISIFGRTKEFSEVRGTSLMCNFGVRSRFLDVIYSVRPPNGSPGQTLWTWIRLLLGEQFNPDPHCLLQRLDWNNLAEHKWRFAGVLMMAQHCWLSSFLIFQGILISIAKKPYISYDFSGGGGSGAPAPLWIIAS